MCRTDLALSNFISRMRAVVRVIKMVDVKRGAVLCLRLIPAIGQLIILCGRGQVQNISFCRVISEVHSRANA